MEEIESPNKEIVEKLPNPEKYEALMEKMGDVPPLTVLLSLVSWQINSSKGTLQQRNAGFIDAFASPPY
jgi:hypothetical protein